ncbi:MAG: NAD-dependent epimerase/dehydratase family protein [Flavobacterium sp.]|nr:MAG: NAD-dependent epimerase/dehydratase family protein [Flavobacterium sp.]
MILVTGATGLIGSHLTLRLLQNGESVRAIYRDEKGVSRTKRLFRLHQKLDLFRQIDWVKADILDIPSLDAAFQNVDYVYHCAALISFDPNDEEALRKTNIEGTANIVNFCLASGVKKLCHVSSMAALGDLKEPDKTITEETEWNPEKPHNDYGISKHGAEMEVWRGFQEGLNVVIVNPGIVIGPPLWETGSSKLFEMIKKEHPFYTLGTMGFVSVDDVVAIMTALMKSEISTERFTLFSEMLSYRDVFFMAADAMHKKRANIEAKPWMTSIGWRLDWIRANVFGGKRIISKDDARSLHTTDDFSNEKIRMALGYNFKSVKEAISESVSLVEKENKPEQKKK